MTKVKKKSIKTIQNKLWKLASAIIKKNYGNVCYTCGQKGLESHNWHVGHMIPRSVCGAFLKYDLSNLRPQCYRCNIHAGGNGAIFKKRMEEREGAAFVEQVFIDSQIVLSSVEVRNLYEGLIKQYEGILKL